MRALLYTGRKLPCIAFNMMTFPHHKELIMTKAIQAFQEQVRNALAQMAEGLFTR